MYAVFFSTLLRRSWTSKSRDLAASSSISALDHQWPAGCVPIFSTGGMAQFEMAPNDLYAEGECNEPPNARAVVGLLLFLRVEPGM